MTDFHNRASLHRRALLLEWITVSWNVLEAVIALTAGVLAGSKALIGFGADSLIETVSAVTLLWRLYRSGPQADSAEHGRVEKRALYLVAATFFLLAVFITLGSGRALLAKTPPETSMVGLILSVLSLLVMPVLAFAKQRTGRALGSKALQADAKETWVCAWLSLALLAGVGLYLLNGWWWADPVGALAMVPVILWQGWVTFGEAKGEKKGGNGMRSEAGSG